MIFAIFTFVVLMWLASAFSKGFKSNLPYLIAIILWFGLVFLKCTVSISGYSHGHRLIILEKISEKGFAFKTWEGTGILQGYANNGEGSFVREMFYFSVENDSLARELQGKLNEAVKNGKRLLVSIEYDEYYFTAITDGDSDYHMIGYIIQEENDQSGWQLKQLKILEEDTQENWICLN